MLVADDKIIGDGPSRVVLRRDPAAHAARMIYGAELKDAGRPRR